MPGAGPASGCGAAGGGGVITKLVEEIPQFFFFFQGAAVSSALVECQVFDADGPPSAILAIDPDEVGILQGRLAWR